MHVAPSNGVVGQLLGHAPVLKGRGINKKINMLMVLKKMRVKRMIMTKRKETNHVLQVGLGQNSLTPLLALNVSLQVDIESTRLIVNQVRQRLGLLLQFLSLDERGERKEGEGGKEVERWEGIERGKKKNLGGASDTERLQSLHGDNPRRDSGSEVLIIKNKK